MAPRGPHIRLSFPFFIPASLLFSALFFSMFFFLLFLGGTWISIFILLTVFGSRKDDYSLPIWSENGTGC